MTTDKPLTAAKIHAVLRKAEFFPSKRETTRIRGWYRYTKGYSLKSIGTADAPRFVLEHLNDSQGFGRSDDPAEMLTKYAAALDAAGIPIENGEDLKMVIG